MNKYELITILSEKLTDEDKVKFAEKIKEFINSQGKLTEVDEWGKKTLAYEIKKQKEGFYILFTFELNPQAVTELTRIIRIDESVLKHLIVKI